MRTKKQEPKEPSAVFQLYIGTENDAFEGDPRPEIARILRDVADRLEAADYAHFFETLWDVNGNDVGRCKLFPSAEAQKGAR